MQARPEAQQLRPVDKCTILRADVVFWDEMVAPERALLFDNNNLSPSLLSFLVIATHLLWSR